MNTIEEIIEDLRQGKMVIIMDDEDRENEGDLIMAASLVRVEDINFMARYGRGLICLTLTRERCQHLRLPLMVQDNATPYSTNFTVSIEAAQGVTTGISAADRARTVLAAIDPPSKPEDLSRPGHMFPLRARPARGVQNVNTRVLEVTRSGLAATLDEFHGEGLLSVGFPYVIPPELLKRFEPAINIHPTLLP